MNPQIKLIDFQTILPVWQNELWVKRVSKIETHSAMVYNSSEYDTKNFSLPVWFFGYYENNSLLGVNSAHLCADGSLRSRGLFVYEKYRGNGIAKLLLSLTVKKHKELSSKFLWSYPRKSSWHVYEKAGFSLTSQWKSSETSEKNAFCLLTS